MGTTELRTLLTQIQDATKRSISELDKGYVVDPSTIIDTLVERYVVDPSITINTLVERAHSTAQEKGWWDTDRSVPECLALVHSEVSEALEAYRDGSFNWSLNTKAKPEGLGAELADICIRVFDLAGHLSIDLGNCIGSKMKYNETRPFRHGGKKA